MNDFKITLGAYASGVIVWTVLICTAALMIANIFTIYNIYIVIDSMWVEIEHIKEIKQIKQIKQTEQID